MIGIDNVDSAEVWQEFIFVNLDGNAKPLAPRLEELKPYIRNQHPGEMVCQWSNEHACNTNWKCVLMRQNH